MRKTLFFFIATFVVAFLTVSCDHDKHIISSGEMEDILYDYHLADAMAQQADGGYAKNAVAYRVAVLKKYDVSQSDFDSSMVYYMRHTDQLHTMYQHISDRMQEEADKLGASSSGGVTAQGDSADVWNGERSFVLIPNEPFNLYSFDLKTDTTFHKGDILLLNFKSDFIFQDGMRDGVVMLAVTLGNDSVASSVTHISSSMASSVQIADNDSLGIKRIRGFFFLAKNNDANSSSTTLQLMSIHDIQLIRVHPKKVPGQQTPMTPAGGRIPVDPNLPDSERMRPQMMR
jgi:hypothetical protein